MCSPLRTQRYAHLGHMAVSIQPVAESYICSNKSVIGGAVLLAAVGARGYRSRKGECQKREYRDGENKDDHENSYSPFSHARNQRPFFVFKRLARTEHPGWAEKWTIAAAWRHFFPLQYFGNDGNSTVCVGRCGSTRRTCLAGWTHRQCGLSMTVPRRSSCRESANC